MRNKPIIRIARDHRSCGSCHNANYESRFSFTTQKVDVIYEIVVGNLVSAVCPDCLRSLCETAFELSNGESTVSVTEEVPTSIDRRISVDSSKEVD